MQRGAERLSQRYNAQVQRHVGEEEADRLSAAVLAELRAWVNLEAGDAARGRASGSKTRRECSELSAKRKPTA